MTHVEGSFDPRIRKLETIKRMQELAKASYPVPITRQPSQQEIATWCERSPQISEATDGGEVEIDGVCSHGYPSWLIIFGLVADPNSR